MARVVDWAESGAQKQARRIEFDNKHDASVRPCGTVSASTLQGKLEACFTVQYMYVLCRSNNVVADSIRSRGIVWSRSYSRISALGVWDPQL